MKKIYLLFAALAALSLGLKAQDSWTIGSSGLTIVLTDSTLAVRGAGAMPMDYAYSDYNYSSWRSSIQHRVAHIVIGDSVTSVAHYMFPSFSNLRDIVLGARVDTVGAYAFQSCYGLRQLENRSNSVYLGDGCFSYCGWADTLVLNGVTGMGEAVFYSNQDLHAVYMPDVEGLLNRTFSYCMALGYVQAPKATCLRGTFDRCSSLQGFDLSAVDSVEEDAFKQAYIKEVYIPNLKYIGYHAFNACDSLRVFTFGDKMEEIAVDAFYRCYELKKLIVDMPATGVVHEGAFNSLYPDTIVANTMMVLDTWTKDRCIVIPANDSIKEAYRAAGYYFEEHDPSFGILVLDPTSLDSLSDVNNNSLLLDFADMRGDHVGALVVGSGSSAHLSRFCKRDYYGTENSWNNWNEQFTWNPTGEPYYNRHYSSLQTALINNGVLSADTVLMRQGYADNNWVFTSLPFDVRVSDIQLPENVYMALRHFDPTLEAQGQDRAAWVDYQATDVIPAGTGFIIRFYDDRDWSENRPSIELEFTAPDSQTAGIFVNSDQQLALSHYTGVQPWFSNWNLLSNPYPSFYNAREMASTGVIGVYCGNGKDGSYSFFSLSDDYYVLQPGECFFYQARPAEQTLDMPASGRRVTARPDSVTVVDDGRLSVSARSQRRLMEVRVAGQDMSDHCRVVINEAASADYEMGVDAPKMTIGDEALLISSTMGDAQLAINERPLGNGSVLLNLTVAQGGDYTLTVEGAPEGAVLVDHQTNTQQPLTEAGYSFYAAAGSYANRFELCLPAKMPSALDATTATPAKAMKQIRNGMLIIVRDGKTYNALGEEM